MVFTEASRRRRRRSGGSTCPKPSGGKTDDNPDDPQDHFDFLLLVQDWPQSTCLVASTQHRACTIPSEVHSWTLHGLWPSRNQLSPQHGPYCCTDRKFDITKIDDLKEDMLVNWPTLFPSNSMEHFWAHEFEKHGTCAEALPKFFATEHEYFNTTLHLKKTYDLKKILGDRKIVPDSKMPYDAKAIKEALTAGLGVTPCVQRSYYKEVDLLGTVMICFDKNLKPIECPYCEHAAEDDDELFYYSISNSKNTEFRGKK